MEDNYNQFNNGKKKMGLLPLSVLLFFSFWIVLFIIIRISILKVIDTALSVNSLINVITVFLLVYAGIHFFFGYKNGKLNVSNFSNNKDEYVIKDNNSWELNIGTIFYFIIGIIFIAIVCIIQFVSNKYLKDYSKYEYITFDGIEVPTYYLISKDEIALVTYSLNYTMDNYDFIFAHSYYYDLNPDKLVEYFIYLVDDGFEAYDYVDNSQDENQIYYYKNYNNENKSIIIYEAKNQISYMEVNSILDENKLKALIESEDYSNENIH